VNKILLICTSDGLIDFTVRCLTKSGYDVISIPDITGVQVLVRSTAIDLIIIDAEVRNESGYDVCKKLKDLDGLKYTPALIMGGTDSANTLLRALEAGADDFLTVGYEESALLSKVRSLLRIKRLSDQLIEQYAELQKKNKLLDMQLNMAMQVQRSLINEHDIEHSDVRLLSRYMPALEIGGDFYDIIKLDDDNVAVVIGDVSGHGISAALLTAMIKMMIKNLAPRYYNPSQFLFHMNNEFASVFESVSQMYACMFYAVISTRRKRIYYSNAGQALPIFVSAETGEAYELEASGTPLGMMKDVSYEHRIALYDEGDMILFYTDGLADNMYKDAADVFYAKIKELLLESRAKDDPGEILDALIDEFCVKDERGRKYDLDDVSMILCRMGHKE